jgi:hypothetical protein
MDPLPYRMTPSLTTAVPGAVHRYQEGIAALVAGRADAGGPLRAAVRLDGEFTLARVGLAVAVAVADDGEGYEPPMRHRALSRGERQHVEVVDVAFGAGSTRAVDLRREHLADFPGDLLVVWLPAVWHLRNPSRAPGRSTP